MLEARHLVKRFFGIPVVNDVTFYVSPGEVVGYLGPNGSGKSTTAKMLTGLLDTSAGAVHWNGRDIARDPVAFRQRLGYVPDHRQSLLITSHGGVSRLVAAAAEIKPQPPNGWSVVTPPVAVAVIVLRHINTCHVRSHPLLRRLLTQGSVQQFRRIQWK